MCFSLRNILKTLAHHLFPHATCCSSHNAIFLTQRAVPHTACCSLHNGPCITKRATPTTCYSSHNVLPPAQHTVPRTSSFSSHNVLFLARRAIPHTTCCPLHSTLSLAHHLFPHTTCYSSHDVLSSEITCCHLLQHNVTSLMQYVTFLAHHDVSFFRNRDPCKQGCKQQPLLHKNVRAAHFKAKLELPTRAICIARMSRTGANVRHSCITRSL